MTVNPLDLLARRPFGYSRPRPELLALVPPDARRVLDLGCGTGELSAPLVSKGVEVVGIDIDPAAVEAARIQLSEAWVADLENDGILHDLRPFDAVICADLLEHLRDPWSTLRKLRPLVSPGGSLVLSVPNVRHLTVVAPLLIQGKWEYRASGLLDVSHLRFFTERSIRGMLTDAGYEIVELRRWPGRPMTGRVMLRLAIGPLSGLFTYQYLLRAEPIE